MKLVVIATLVSLFAVELSLRFIVKKHLTYTEQNGHFISISPYVSAELNKLGKLRNGLWVNKPGKSKVNSVVFSYEHDYNAQGLREVEFTPELAQDTNLIKIVTLGDSFTEGMGTVSDSTWINLLANRLNDRGFSKKIKGLNGGVIGSDPVFCRKLYERELAKLNPSIVILAINGTDFLDVLLKGGEERYISETEVQFKKSPLRGYLNQFSYIARMINFDLLKYNRALLTDEQAAQQKIVVTNAILHEIEALKQLIETEGGQFIVVFHPKVTDFEEGELYIQPLVDATAQKKNIHFINLYDYFKKEMNVNNLYDYYWRIDKHHNNKGYEIFAQGIEEYLLENDLIGE